MQSDAHVPSWVVLGWNHLHIVQMGGTMPHGDMAQRPVDGGIRTIQISNTLPLKWFGSAF